MQPHDEEDYDEPMEHPSNMPMMPIPNFGYPPSTHCPTPSVSAPFIDDPFEESDDKFLGVQNKSIFKCLPPNWNKQNPFIKSISKWADNSDKNVISHNTLPANELSELMKMGVNPGML